MANDVVKQITDNGRIVIDNVIGGDGYKKLDYQEPEQFRKNNLRGHTKRYGWVSSVAINNDDTAPLQHQAFDHTFLLTLITDYNTKDDDTAQENAKNELYEKILDIAVELRKTKVNATPCVMNVLVGEIAEPDFLDNNCSVALVTAIIVQYRYRI